MRATSPRTWDGWLSRVFFGAALVGPCLLVQDAIQGHGVGWLAADLAIGVPGLVLGYFFRWRDIGARGGLRNWQEEGEKVRWGVLAGVGLLLMLVGFSLP